MNVENRPCSKDIMLPQGKFKIISTCAANDASDQVRPTAHAPSHGHRHGSEVRSPVVVPIRRVGNCSARSSLLSRRLRRPAGPAREGLRRHRPPDANPTSVTAAVIDVVATRLGKRRFVCISIRTRTAPMSPSGCWTACALKSCIAWDWETCCIRTNWCRRSCSAAGDMRCAGKDQGQVASGGRRGFQVLHTISHNSAACKGRRSQSSPTATPNNSGRCSM